MMNIETILTPAGIRALDERDLSGAVFVVFDILRATSTMVTALANGAARILTAQEVEEALLLKRAHPAALLAGERGGHRITAEISGSVDFDLGNSPREFSREQVHDRTIIMTTTNGTRAFHAVSPARVVLVGSFLNLSATAEAVRTSRCKQVLLVCAGTGDGAAYEDTLAAGALVSKLAALGPCESDDATRMAMDLFAVHGSNLQQALILGANGKRLAADPALKDDIAHCARLDTVSAVVAATDGFVTLLPQFTS
jgi:2-phosphosulfolactate phosphatase